MELSAEIILVSENSVLVIFGDEISEDINKKVRAFSSYLDMFPFEGMIEYVPAFTSVTITYSPIIIRDIKKILKQVLAKVEFVQEKKCIVKIPVLYGGEYGPDLEEVASHNNLTPEQVVKLHSENEYLVYMIGFAPGFPYLGGMSSKIATPRKKTPRLSIEAGSVGIAGNQTGVYSISTPGGWQIIGRTPIQLFSVNQNPHSLLKAGDRVKFYSITYNQYIEMGRK